MRRHIIFACAATLAVTAFVGGPSTVPAVATKAPMDVRLVNVTQPVPVALSVADFPDMTKSFPGTPPLGFSRHAFVSPSNGRVILFRNQPSATQWAITNVIASGPTSNQEPAQIAVRAFAPFQDDSCQSAFTIGAPLVLTVSPGQTVSVNLTQPFETGTSTNEIVRDLPRCLGVELLGRTGEIDVNIIGYRL